MVFSPMRLVSFTLAAASLVHAIERAFDYDNEKVRGVNLGGWLVLEPWVTPELFDPLDKRIIDEYTFGQYQDHDVALKTLEEHWATWITEDDIQQIADAGLNHIRVPIGYWAYDVGAGEPFIQGTQREYFKQAVGWARNHGLKFIADLHGAPGSQNGYDNSGQKLKFDDITWHRNQTNVERTLKVIETMVDDLKDDQDVVTIIATLNEPAGWGGPDIVAVAREYNLASYNAVAFPNGPMEQSPVVTQVHDAFQNFSSWEDLTVLDGIMMDTHIYQMFTPPQIALTDEEHIASACSRGQELEDFQQKMWIVVGEWTPSADDCAKHLNSRDTGSRYEGTLEAEPTPRVGSCEGRTGDASTFSEERKEFLGRMWSAQTSSYERGGGWIQWTWKTAAQEWSYKSGLEHGWIPQDPTVRLYPDVCENLSTEPEPSSSTPVSSTEIPEATSVAELEGSVTEATVSPSQEAPVDPDVVARHLRRSRARHH